VIASVQRLERAARSQFDRLYEGTRRSAAGLVAIDRRAVDRVHEMIAFTRSEGRDRVGTSGRQRASTAARAARPDQ